MPQNFLHIFVVVFSFFSVFAAPVFAAGTDDGSNAASTTSASYADAKAMVEAGNYTDALPAFEAITKTEPQNADAWNMLGFTHRMLGNAGASAEAYLVVLKINPNHLGALEYQGELFLQTGKPDLAKANLAKLKGLCGTCEEFEDLEKAITAAGV
jgi:predicted Zn-dependent protease